MTIRRASSACGMLTGLGCKILAHPEACASLEAKTPITRCLDVNIYICDTRYVPLESVKGGEKQRRCRYNPFNPKKHHIARNLKEQVAIPTTAQSRYSKLAPHKSTHLMNSLPGSTCNLNSLLLGSLTIKCKCKRLNKGQIPQLGRGELSGVINVFIGNTSFCLLDELKNSASTYEKKIQCLNTRKFNVRI